MSLRCNWYRIHKLFNGPKWLAEGNFSVARIFFVPAVPVNGKMQESFHRIGVWGPLAYWKGDFRLQLMSLHLDLQNSKWIEAVATQGKPEGIDDLQMPEVLEWLKLDLLYDPLLKQDATTGDASSPMKVEHLLPVWELWRKPNTLPNEKVKTGW